MVYDFYSPLVFLCGTLFNCFYSPNKLRCPRESEVTNWDDILTVPDDTGLLTVKCWRKIVEDQTVKSANKKSTFLRSKYSEIDCALVSFKFSLPRPDF